MSQKIVIITGANRGFGFELARQFALRKFKVIITSRTVSSGKRAQRILNQEGFSIEFIQLNVEKLSSIEKFYNQVHRKYKRIDILINNAGIAPDAGKTINDVQIGLIEKAIRTNALGPTLLIQKISNLMNIKGGRVINISSGMGLFTNLDYDEPSYRLSKLMMDAITIMFSKKLKAQKITVNSVYPGVLKTRMGSFENGRDLAEATETVLWLACTNAGHKTGRIFKDRKVLHVAN